MPSNWRKNTRIIQALLAPIVVIGITVFANDATAWTITADFESGTVGQKAKGPHAFNDAGNKTTFSNEKAHSGTQSAKMVWTRGDTGFNNNRGMISFPSKVKQGQEIWGRMYVYFQSPWSWDQADQGQADRVKILRFHERDANGNHVGYTSIVERSKSNRLYLSQEGDKSDYFDNSFNVPAFDQWFAVELYVKFHPTNGILRAWVDGQLKLEQTNVKTADFAAGNLDFAYFMSYWNGGSPQFQVQYIDDVILTTDIPAELDDKGNPMIGSGPAISDTTPPAPPKALRIN